MQGPGERPLRSPRAPPLRPSAPPPPRARRAAGHAVDGKPLANPVPLEDRRTHSSASGFSQYCTARHKNWAIEPETVRSLDWTTSKIDAAHQTSISVEDAPTLVQYGALYACYRHGCRQWYEAFFLTRRTVFAVLHVTLSPYPELRQVCYFLLLVFLTATQVWLLPYRLRGDNLMATWLMISLVVISALEIPLLIVHMNVDRSSSSSYASFFTVTNVRLIDIAPVLLFVLYFLFRVLRHASRPCRRSLGQKLRRLLQLPPSQAGDARKGTIRSRKYRNAMAQFKWLLDKHASGQQGDLRFSDTDVLRLVDGSPLPCIVTCRPTWDSRYICQRIWGDFTYNIFDAFVKVEKLQ